MSQARKSLKSLTHAFLIESMGYCEATGVFMRKVSAGPRRAGQSAGHHDKTSGYVVVGLNGTRYLAHRLAWFYVHGEWPEKQIDHRDGCRANNAIKNLRPATQAQNSQNQGPGQGKRVGRQIGVYPARAGRWVAQIGIDGKRICLGTFGTKAEAAKAYMDAKVRLHPFQTIIAGVAQ